MKFFVNSKPRRDNIYKSHYVGNIDIQGGVVNIIDPGYVDFDKYSTKVNVKPGTYKCYIDLIDIPYKVMYEKHDYEVRVGNKKDGDTELKHDNRISSVYILHEDYTKFTPKEYWSIIGNIGVDAGVAGFYNYKPIYSTDEDWMVFGSSLKTLDEYPSITCDVKSTGITVSSGDGDGCYPVYAAKHKDDIVSLGISFYD